MADQVDSTATPSTVTETPATSREVNPAEAEATPVEEVVETKPEDKAVDKQTKDAAKKEEKRLKKLKLKVDGQEIEEEIDLDDEETLKKHLQMSKAAQKRMSEAAQLKKDVESFLENLKGNTAETLKMMGIDPQKFAEAVIQQQIEDMKKSPEQKEKEEMQKKVEALEKQLEKEKKEKESADLHRLQVKYEQEFEQSIIKALDNNPTLPHSPYVVKRIADLMIAALDRGVEDVSVDDVLPMVKDQIYNELQNMFELMPEEVLEQTIGKKNLDRMRNKRLKSMKPKVETSNSVKPTGNTAKKEEDKMGMDDFFKKLGTL